MSGEKAVVGIVDETVSLQIDGRTVPAQRGQMIIEAADEAGIIIPRFCYHRNLSVAANCRMCLIEIKGVGKPAPACATPIADGMQVFTGSPLARRAQKGVMEFLLVNHPLDCPICDQGGECELQDLALGYGRDVSVYTESKRVVKDKDIGPLIATDMTRCIHCTRCVRFGTEIAGVRELGATGRGEHTEIGTYIEKSVSSELSGNIIDLCPVGALTSKPFRFRARSWELSQRKSIAAHDAIGSNVFVHVCRNEVMRVVPRDNEAINETWISDRDRFSYEGLNAKDRLQVPMVKEKGVWREADWEEALRCTAAALGDIVEAHGAEQIGALVAPTATVEEAYLLSRLTRGLGSSNIDHRLRQCDFRDQQDASIYPSLGQRLRDIEDLDTALIIGSNLRCELPILAHRLRKAGRKGCRVIAINPVDFDWHLPIHSKLIVAPSALAETLAGILAALRDIVADSVSEELEPTLAKATLNEHHREIAWHLARMKSGAVLLGNIATSHPDFSILRRLGAAIAAKTGARLGVLPQASNSVGAGMAGALPHRAVGGTTADASGLDASAMLRAPRRGYLLFGLEPEFDTSDPVLTVGALDAAVFTVAMTAYAGEGLRQCADVLLPIATFAETSGTYVNLEGTWQSFEAVVSAAGSARPGWKVLRVLANSLNLDGFGYTSTAEIREELAAATVGMVGLGLQTSTLESPVPDPQLVVAIGELERVGEVPMYAVDATVRRAQSLQRTEDATYSGIRVCAELASRLGLREAAMVTVVQGEQRAELPLRIDARVADGCAWVPAGVAATRRLGPAFGTIRLEQS